MSALPNSSAVPQEEKRHLRCSRAASPRCQGLGKQRVPTGPTMFKVVLALIMTNNTKEQPEFRGGGGADICRFAIRSCSNCFWHSISSANLFIFASISTPEASKKIGGIEVCKSKVLLQASIFCHGGWDRWVGHHGHRVIQRCYTCRSPTRLY